MMLLAWVVETIRAAYAVCVSCLGRRRQTTWNGIVLDPRGSSGLKNLLGLGMAKIARRREMSKISQSTPQALEAFHAPDPHDFWNESHYYNGCDGLTNDRFITRISRRGQGANVSYIFLLLDIAGHGTFSLEADDVPVDHSDEHPSGLGLSFTCEKPLQRWRLRYAGPMRRGCVHPSLALDMEELTNSGQSVHVELDLIYERETPLFWYALLPSSCLLPQVYPPA